LKYNQSLHIAHWGLRRGLHSLDLIRTNLTRKKYQFSVDPGFTTYDLATKKRQPVLYLGDLNDFPANKQERLVWDILQSISSIRDWVASEEGHRWNGCDIVLLIPNTKESGLKWQLMSKLAAYFERRNESFPDNLFIDEVSESEALAMLQSLDSQAPQIVIVADCMLDNSYVAKAEGIANESSGSGRILSESVAWLALLPDNDGAVATATLISDELEEFISIKFIELNQQWLREQYQVGESLLFCDDLITTSEHLNRKHTLYTYCFPASTAPRDKPESDKKADIQAFNEALENEELLNHQIIKQALHFYIGDCGLAKILASLVVTLEQLNTDFPDTKKALIYQETNKDAYSYLVTMQANNSDANKGLTHGE
jgi:hypothetical protein